MKSFYPAPSRWFRQYLIKKGCKCSSMGNFEIWNKDDNKTRITKDCIFQKQICKMKLKNLVLSFEEFDKALEKYKSKFKRIER